ncbi:LOW QUALITY PROTEIN: striated muscle-specific serine/threonine-protein kinase [Drosophila sulfurigaster albostrigata]|uniref:Striated muscle-specific serine/threonine-protein kinase isoform X2 n=1 Tax=Drosophila albomicans TaxID=7291 RepID=A0A6P8X631_DROAB|nr:striated muscle-specific serine/threonine-protein kinase isoform X2 [Drosophila albomicans]XP_060656150.1 striated muscle-specific serine/threonine-protein kinase isoform X2 [Drosophila nasuta]XP_062131518.1 LOW QUALITY PROTEIN: striated muscle-specific serine/threonine-protein kinase [Drosophila sulfurigaster albostrigata]
MKFFVFIALALIGFAAGAQLPDSATQGPNPQDIATPEPEYIDIEEPAPIAAAPAPRPVAPLPLARPVARPVAIAQNYVQQPIAQRAQYLPPLAQQQQAQHISGHAYSSQSGYQYRRPVYH